MALKPMTDGREVVEDYGTLGLSLRAHPVSFLRQELKAGGLASCAEVSAARDGRSLKAAGQILVRQRPGSAKGVMFITIEDETGVAHLVVWEKYRRAMLTGSMLKIDCRVQREGEVVHLVAYKLEDLSPLLASLGQRQAPFPLPHGRGDEGHHGPHGPDPRDSRAPGVQPRDIYVRDLQIDAIKQQTRDFR